MTQQIPVFSGAVLVGGRSSRFGQNKALYRWHGQPLLQWALDSLAGAGEHLLVGANPLPAFGLPQVEDAIAGGDSLSGIHAALLHAQHPWVAVTACDTPMLSREYWQHLLEQAHPNVQAVVGQGPSGFLEPLGGLYHRSALTEVEQRLRSGDYKLQALLQGLKCTVLDWPSLEAKFGPKLYLNANRLEDLEL